MATPARGGPRASQRRRGDRARAGLSPGARPWAGQGRARVMLAWAPGSGLRALGFSALGSGLGARPEADKLNGVLGTCRSPESAAGKCRPGRRQNSPVWRPGRAQNSPVCPWHVMPLPRRGAARRRAGQGRAGQGRASRGLALTAPLPIPIPSLPCPSMGRAPHAPRPGWVPRLSRLDQARSTLPVRAQASHGGAVGQQRAAKTCRLARPRSLLDTQGRRGPWADGERARAASRQAGPWLCLAQHIGI